MKNLFRCLVKKTIRLYSNYIINRKHSLDTHTCHRIAYFIAGGIGDAIMAYPAIQFLQKRLHNVKINVFVPPEKYPILSEIFGDLRVKPLKLTPRFILGYTVKENRFDLSFTNATAVFKVRVEVASFILSRMPYGFRYKEERQEDRLYRNSKIFSGITHAVEQNIQLVSETIKIPYTEADLDIPAVGHEKKKSATKTVIIHPGSEAGYENKRWPIENFIAVAMKLVEKGYTITALLGPSEKDLGEAFAAVTNAQLLIEPDTQKLIETFKNAVLFIGNDSGPAHLAAFYGVPAVTLFGPINPERSGPVALTNTSIYNRIDCSPCHFTMEGCQDNQCLKSISVEQVWRETEKNLT